MMWWWNDGWNGYWHGPWMFGPVFMIVAIIFCVAMMFLMMRGMGRHRDDRHALQILKERFARGEINKAEYEEQRRLLEV
jgi:putative membrane protein